ncbi:MAG TPA: MASE1 domain-containing protein [Candidatus Acidoferrales bacterium]|nr:MASE1 domain-containing protein [Candidatus Acidoferrales bacterium]
MNIKRKELATAAALAAVYFGAAKLGLKFAFVNPSATAVWAPTGIALAGLLIFGVRVWPGIFLGAFFANLTTAGTVLTSLGIATGNTLEGVVGCYLVNRFAHGHRAFERAQDIFRFTFLAGMVSTAISATIGVTTLSLAGFAHWPMYAPIWRTWWLGDGVGAVVIAPLVLLWRKNRPFNWKSEHVAEGTLLFLGLFLAAWVVFGERFQSELKHDSLEYICIPFLIWAAFRFSPRNAAAANCLLAGIATWGTVHGFGPFAADDPNTSLLLAQVFIGIMAISSLALAAEISGRKRAAQRFRLAVESAPNAMVMTDQRGKIVLVNAQATKMFGYKEEELVGQLTEVLVPPRFRGGHPVHRAGFSAQPQARPMGAGRDLYAVRKDGSEFPVEIGLNPIETEEGLMVLSAIVDITARKAAEEEIRSLAISDPLTGLANYRKLIDTLDAEIKRFDRTRRYFAVLLLDLDQLKKINDVHGHVAGSRALCRLASILRDHCREIDTPARYGGDEFAVVLPETDSAQARKIAARIRRRVACDEERPPISVSVGCAIFPHDGETIEKLLSAADRALYDMKRSPADTDAPRKSRD